MNRRQKLLLALALAACCVIVLNVAGAPSRVTPEVQERRDRVILRLAQIHADEADESAKAADTEEVEAAAETPQPKEDDMWPEKAPEVFRVKFECTNGEFIVECVKEWAPIGAERFYQLVREGYFDDTGFFRVVPNFVVQFGLAADPQVTAKWRSKTLKDDPVKQTNAPGTITFATSGPNSRTTQLFINLANNQRLDGMGFAPFGRVVEGMEVVKKINAEYGEQPKQQLITLEGNSYLRKNFPNLDYIKKAALMK